MHMHTILKCNFLAIAGFSVFPFCVQAAPGDLDAAFAPVIRRTVAPDSVQVAPDGRILLGGSREGFDRIDGVSTGDRVLLNPDGTVHGEPVPGLLEPTGGFLSIGIGGVPVGRRETGWFPIGEGQWLIPCRDGGWLKLDESGTPAPFFNDVPENQQIHPQFLAGERLWVIRVADGNRVVEARDRTDGAMDPAFQPSGEWPGPPVQLVPASDGGAWVLGGDS